MMLFPSSVPIMFIDDVGEERETDKILIYITEKSPIAMISN